MPCAVTNGQGYSSVVDIFNVLSGTWTTAVLSQARLGLVATSLPNAGVAIFAGGCTSCNVCVRCCRMDIGVRGMHVLVECGCVYDTSLSHALCSHKSSRLLQCCGHLQRVVWNLEHCSPQPGSRSCSNRVAAESRSRDLRWRPMYVLLLLFGVLPDGYECEGDA